VVLGIPAGWVSALRAMHGASDRPVARLAVTIVAIETMGLVVVLIGSLLGYF
jgi:hypothetical protein